MGIAHAADGNDELFQSSKPLQSLNGAFDDPSEPSDSVLRATNKIGLTYFKHDDFHARPLINREDVALSSPEKHIESYVVAVDWIDVED